MTRIDLEVKSINLAARFGEIPHKRENADELVREIGEKTLLLIDLKGVQDIAGTFLRSAIFGLQEQARNYVDETPIWVFTNAEEDAGLALNWTLRHMRTGAAVNTYNGVGIWPRTTHLNSTYEATKALTTEHGTFTASQLAEVLAQKQPNTNQRLKLVSSLGALTRKRDPSAKHGTRYLYRAITDEDVASQIQLF